VLADDYFLAKAEQCRRLAEKIVNPADPALAGLLKLAAEFEAKAASVRREFTSTRIAS
jgi:uncharacterized membrane-anchored protein